MRPPPAAKSQESGDHGRTTAGGGRRGTVSARRRLTVLAVALAALTGCTAARTPAAPTHAASATPSATTSGGTPARPFTVGEPARPAAIPAPPTTQECLQRESIRCYAPAQLARAYNLEPLWRAGWTGGGRTIAIVDSFGSPTIREDLHAFHAAFGYPQPQLQLMTPARQHRAPGRQASGLRPHRLRPARLGRGDDARRRVGARGRARRRHPARRD